MGPHKRHRRPSTSTSEDSEDDDEDVTKKKRCRSHSSSKKKRRKMKKPRKVSSSSTDSSSDSSSSSSSSSSSDSEEEKKRRKKRKKMKPKLKKTTEEKKEDENEGTSADIPLDLMDRSKTMAPMTKEEWEKRQNVVRRVYDESTGRHRLIKGDGEVVEEIVSRDRHKAINQQATKGDGDYFQSHLATRLKH